MILNERRARSSAERVELRLTDRPGNAAVTRKSAFHRLFGRVSRTEQRPLLAGYPASLRRVIFWYDSLTDWQRVQYAIVAMLFLIACGGYLLGLGSTIILQRVEAQEAALAAQPLPTALPTATVGPTPFVTASLATLARSPEPSPTQAPPTEAPTQTPFSAPVIAEPPAAPRQLPEAPVVAVAPAVPAAPRATPTPAKPRNLETSKPEPPAASLATPTPGRVQTEAPVVPTAVRQTTPAATSKPTGRTATSLPTLRLPATPTPAPPRATTGPTPGRTPPVR